MRDIDGEREGSRTMTTNPSPRESKTMSKVTLSWKTIDRSPEAAILLADPHGDIYSNRYPSWGGREGVLELQVSHRKDGTYTHADVIDALDEWFERI